MNNNLAGKRAIQFRKFTEIVHNYIEYIYIINRYLNIQKINFYEYQKKMFSTKCG